MGIFDIFKTKLKHASAPQTEPSERAGDVSTEQQDANMMVSEGGPVAEFGEAAPGAGDDAYAASQVETK